MSYNEEQVFIDYEEIKQLSKERNSKEFCEIHAKAIHSILYNHKLFKSFNIQGFNIELEKLAVQHKDSDVIYQYWIDGIESVYEYHGSKNEKDEIEKMAQKFLKYVKARTFNGFYDEAYAQLLHCSLSERLIRLHTNGESIDATKYIDNYLIKISIYFPFHQHHIQN